MLTRCPAIQLQKRKTTQHFGRKTEGRSEQESGRWLEED